MSEDNNKQFYISNKKEFLITYPDDYFGSLIEEEILKLFPTDTWEYVLSKETGHEVTEHDHFHLYLNYIGKNKRGFSCKGQNAERIWDVVLKIESEEQKQKYITNEWPKDKDNNKIRQAHPNIKFKGDKSDPNCKNSYKMIDYVTKQSKELEEKDWRITSSFDWQKRLKELEKKKKGRGVKDSKDEWEYSFCDWLRNQLKERPNATKKEIVNDIINDSKWNFLYMSKHYNYNLLINNVFKEKQMVKPIPFFGKFWVPRDLKFYLDYLNDWFRLWFEGKNPTGTRPSALYLSGCGCSGKSSLIAAFGTFSYWCNVWNMNNWEGEASYNVFDDYDGSEDYKGNQIQNNKSLGLMKPWVGGQPLVTISGKFKQPVTVKNDKPCIIISNKRFSERWDEDSCKYWKDCGATVVDLGDFRLNKSPEEQGISRATIGGFCKYVEYDTKETYYYKNVWLPEHEKNENETIEMEPIFNEDIEVQNDQDITAVEPIENVDNASEIDHEEQTNIPILLPDLPEEINNENEINIDLLNEVEEDIKNNENNEEEEDKNEEEEDEEEENNNKNDDIQFYCLGRPSKKRRNPFAISDSDAEEGNKRSKTSD